MLLIAAAFMSSTLVTPLYVLYRNEFGFSEITLTLIYSVYVVGNLVALFFFGRVSDEIGRRRVAFAGIGKRAAVVSALFAVIFIGNSVPIIGIGVLITLSSALTANIVFACTVAAFAIVAVFAGVRFSVKNAQG